MERVENNVVKISGTVVSKELTFSHELYGESFYTFELASKRLSDTVDIIVIMISENSIMYSKIRKDQYLYIEGSYRSYNKHEGDESKLILTVWPKEIWEINPEVDDINKVFLKGFITSPVIYRKTPEGRKIAEIKIGIKRLYGKLDYIPCIVWGDNAERISYYEVGNEVTAYGRIQSRIYYKEILDEQEEDANKQEELGKRVEVRMAYEVSISKIE